MKKNVSDYLNALTLDLIRAEGLRGRVYTMAQFAKKFEYFKAEDYDWPEGETWKHKEILAKDCPVVLCLDLGTTTGWALRTSDGTIISGTISFKNSRFEGGGMRYLKFANFLDEIHSMEKVSQVYFEEVRRHLGVDAAHAYGGFLAHLTAWCEKNKIAYEGVPVGTIKKHATGKGNASKAMVIKSVTRRGHSPSDDNEADAIALAYWAIGNRQ